MVPCRDSNWFPKDGNGGRCLRSAAKEPPPLNNCPIFATFRIRNTTTTFKIGICYFYLYETFILLLEIFLLKKHTESIFLTSISNLLSICEGNVESECRPLLRQPGKAVITLTNLQSVQPSGSCVTDSIYIGIFFLFAKRLQYMQTILDLNYLVLSFWFPNQTLLPFLPFLIHQRALLPSLH